MAVIEPTLPAPGWKAGKGGRPAEHCRRDIADAIRYLVKEGIQWRAMPCDFPPFQAVYDVLDRWENNGAPLPKILAPWHLETSAGVPLRQGILYPPDI